jgi:predicted transglutaminase-like cysteine proteinase
LPFAIPIWCRTTRRFSFKARKVRWFKIGAIIGLVYALIGTAAISKEDIALSLSKALPVFQALRERFPKSHDRAGVPPLNNLSPAEMAAGQKSAAASAVTEKTELAAKWLELQSRIRTEQETLATCRSGNSSCPDAARKFLSMIELARAKEGRARIGEINRAVNLSIKPTTDLPQYGVADYWSAPLATLTTGAGDCEDYAILKYAALREAGIDDDDLQLMLVHDIKHNTLHAVLVVRLGEEWIILDNQMLIMLNVLEARHYYPLFVLNHRGVRDAVSTAFRTLKPGSGS